MRPVGAGWVGAALSSCDRMRGWIPGWDLGFRGTRGAANKASSSLSEIARSFFLEDV